MAKIKQSGRGAKPTGAGTPTDTLHEDVEQVLEHISSPFRWEIIDVPLDEKKNVKRARTIKIKGT